MGWLRHGRGRERESVDSTDCERSRSEKLVTLGQAKKLTACTERLSGHSSIDIGEMWFWIPGWIAGNMSVVKGWERWSFSSAIQVLS